MTQSSSVFFLFSW